MSNLPLVHITINQIIELQEDAYDRRDADTVHLCAMALLDDSDALAKVGQLLIKGEL